MTAEKAWYDQYPPSWPTEIEYPEISVRELLYRRTDEFADRTAIVFEGRTYSYADLRTYSDTVAATLASLGVGEGDHVSICLPNCPQYTFAFYGTLALGAVTVHTSFMYTESELERQLSDAEAETLIILDAYADKADAVVDDTPVENVIVVSLSEWAAPSVSKFLGRTNTHVVERRGWPWLDDLLDDHRGEQPPTPDIDVDALASLPYTGGTTGFPKGVRITHRNWVSEAAMGELADLCAYDEDGSIERGEQTITGAMPMFHINGNWSANLNAVYNGASVVLYPEFDPGTVLADVERYEISHMHTVPTMLTGLLDRPDIEATDFSSLRHVIAGSAPVPKETKEQFEALTGATVYEGWGQTEIAMVATTEPLDNRRQGSCGIPLPGVDVDVRDVETDESLPAGEVGELAVRSEHLMDGYWKRPDKTAETIRDGWLYTGDLGYRDEDWFIYHVDRKDDMIVTSGHNVYPAEVENVLYEHSSVREAAVIGFPDEYRGRIVAAFIELQDSVDAATDELEEELDAFCRERLAAYKVPRRYEFRELPKTDVGKISRQELKEDIEDQ
jgi:long-chain acyl-CoA synthetase